MDIVTYALLNGKIKDYASNVDEWLEENVDPATGYVLDRSLQMENAAAPADMVGDINVEVGDLKNTLNHKADVIYDTASGDIASFTDGADGLPVKDLTVAIEPVQSGTGNPSPDNVRPISGRTGCNVSSTGKNLLPITVDSLKTLNLSGTWSGNNFTNRGITYEVQVDNDGNVTGININGTASGGNAYFRLVPNTFDIKAGSIINGCPSGMNYETASLITYQSNDSTIIGYDIGNGYTFSSDYENVNMYIRIANGVSVSNKLFRPMLRKSNDSSDFVPYQCTTIPISWQSEAGTVYGCTLDVTTGVLTVTMGYVDLGTLNPLISSLVSNGVTIPISNAKKWVGGTYLPNGLNSAYKKVLSNEQYFTGGAEWTIRLSTDAGGILMSNPQWAGKTAEQIKADLSGVYYCYELATPQIYQLDPVTVSTLLGQNNIWSDCGPVSVEYPADTKLYIQKINTPTDDDMIADANIASGKYFIVNNNLYLSTATITAGEAIVPGTGAGTNCTATSLAAALNALNT